MKLINDNRVETGLAGGPGGGNPGGGGRRGPARGRNPRNMLAVVAAETSLGIPDAFRDLVSSSGSSGGCGSVIVIGEKRERYGRSGQAGRRFFASWVRPRVFGVFEGTQVP